MTRGPNLWGPVRQRSNSTVISLAPSLFAIGSSWMAAGTNAVCHYQGRSDPPKNYTDWSELIGALGSHLVAKYGEETAAEFYFEV